MSSETKPHPGHVFWLFGLSGAGKSTLAGALTSALRAGGVPVLTLDGDVLRTGLCAGLGYSDADRAENLRRAAETSKLALASGLSVVASFITPRQSHRDLVSQIVGRDRLSWIHVDAPLDICRQRDAKGLYARAASGHVQQMTGMTSLFDPPMAPDLTIPTGSESVTASVTLLLNFARAHIPQHPAHA